MSSKKGKKKGRTINPTSDSKLIATVENDITIPKYSDALKLGDPTITAKGEDKGLKLYDEVLRDGRIRSVFNKRLGKVTRREWVVRPGGERPVDIKAAEEIERILKRLPFDAICKSLLGAIMKGFAISEILWDRTEDGLIAPVGVKSHNPSRFVFDRDWNPRLLTQDNKKEGVQLPERKFIVHRFDAEGNNAYGLGLGSTLFWHVLFKREGVAFWMKFMDKFAAPIPFARYPSGTPKPEQDALYNLLVNMVQRGAIIAPLGTEIEFLEATRAGDAGFESWCRYWDEQSAEVVLGGNLTTGAKGQGSRAASQTHADEADAIVDDDADQLSATLNDTLIRWICDANWSDAVPPTVWRPRPRNEAEEVELGRKRYWKQHSAIRVLEAVRLQGYEPENLEEWLGEVLETPVVQAKLPLPAATPAKSGAEDASFAESSGPVDFLADQLAELASDPTEAWLEEIRQKLSGATNFAEASKALLEIFPELDIDPMGNVLGDAFALSELIGRSDVFDETGIYPAQPKGSKKKT